MFEQFMFEGERKDGKGKVKGYFFVTKRYNREIPIIGKSVQNGSVNGFEVKPETVQHLTPVVADACNCVRKGTMKHTCPGLTCSVCGKPHR